MPAPVQGEARRRVELLWASGAMGMKLQQSSSLAASGWQTIADSEFTNRLDAATGGEAAFLRLIGHFISDP